MAAAVTVVGYAVLLLLGFVAGVVCGLSASWLSWFWGTGAPGAVLAGGALVVFLVLLHTGCRTAGWAMESQIGAAMPAVGWVGAGVLLVVLAPAGDIMLLGTGISHAFLLGSTVAAVLGAMLADFRRS